MNQAIKQRFRPVKRRVCSAGSNLFVLFTYAFVELCTRQPSQNDQAGRAHLFRFRSIWEINWFVPNLFRGFLDWLVPALNPWLKSKSVLQVEILIWTTKSLFFQEILKIIGISLKVKKTVGIVWKKVFHPSALTHGWVNSWISALLKDAKWNWNFWKTKKRHF